MRKIAIIAALLLVSSCTKQVLNEAPLGYSFMPDYLNVDSINPVLVTDTNKIVDSTMEDYVSIPVTPGVLTFADGKKLTLPNGVLISERKAMLYPFYKSSWERQQKELYYTKYLMKEYYSKAKAAEILYQSEIVRWKKEAQRSWLEKNMPYIGFGSGLVTMILVDFALFYGGLK
jgi:hypothetical protein